ncbi:hypothetical protein CKW39_10295 [Kocuria sp. WRN011]|uniref:hypothetical protein n=1 Tax=Kocuria TaxID=57493 RepID=UPI000BAFB1F0|nr:MULTISPECIES: hypothetical protein [Kocuria]MCT1801466.1 hypothetical protein [Kocuria carniphila]PBB08195.1 hypothetical protein CKW39_10295 [Kocuria sp. WRN011]PZP31817.1 MAG: hypothetical protein DI613_08775 [Kocuria rhizophila]
MGMWSKLALIAAGAIAGSVATRVANNPKTREAIAGQLERRRSTEVQLRSGSAVQRMQAVSGYLQDFAARVKSGMNERETELREQFGVRTPVDHTANHPGAGGPHTVVGPQDNVESTEIINRGQSSEGNNR